MMSTALLAQVDTGTITGSVRDSQGAGIASASVSFVEVSTNATFKTVTDGSGEYVSPPLRPGTYKTVAEAQGFKTQTRNTVTLKIQDRLRIDFDMAVGSVSENVEVTSDIPIMQTETSSLGQVITSTQITELPLNGRDYIQLATLSTGVVRTSSGTNGNSGGSSTGGQNSFVANGTRGTLNNFLLDGIDNNSNDNGGVVLRTNVDAIQEFKLQTNSYSAEFGRSGGAVVNAIIKSGTNHIHGNVFEFFRNSALDARDYFETFDGSKSVLQAKPIRWHPRWSDSSKTSCSGLATIRARASAIRSTGNRSSQRRRNAAATFLLLGNRSSTIRQLACHSRVTSFRWTGLIPSARPT